MWKITFWARSFKCRTAHHSTDPRFGYSTRAWQRGGERGGRAEDVEEEDVWQLGWVSWERSFWGSFEGTGDR